MLLSTKLTLLFLFFTKTALLQLLDVLQNLKSRRSSKLKEQFLNDAHKIKEIISKILQQQREIYKGNKVKDRIVSLWADHNRPMGRGKYPVHVEFGPKVLLSKVSKIDLVHHPLNLQQTRVLFQRKCSKSNWILHKKNRNPEKGETIYEK
ncbi:MAG: hypothetical protein KKD35_01050 [Elusimicrobia bacterium]|nr:hypothetical protein [Elusimicrobiota bacterium]